MVEGMRHGYGVYKFASSSRYEGNWVNDKKEGKGTMYYTNGEMYYGEW